MGNFRPRRFIAECTEFICWIRIVFAIIELKNGCVFSREDKYLKITSGIF